MVETTVLHVDDDPALLQLVEQVFDQEAQKLAYASAASSQEARERLEEIDGPVVLLLDRRLPGGDVWSLVEEVRRALNVAAVPTFVLSGLEDPEAIEEAYAKGAVGYLEKPMDAEGFFEIVRMLERFVELARFPDPPPR